MNNVVEQLFRGEVRPGEKMLSDTERYRKALRASNAAHTALLETLNEEQEKLLTEALNAKAEVTYLDEVSSYGEGLRLGMRLMMEVGK